MAQTNYLLSATKPVEHRFAYIGIPHDAATSLGNPGGRFGPQALRDALRGVFDWRLQDSKLAHNDRGLIDLSGVEVADLGDVVLSYYDTDKTVEEIYRVVKEALDANYFPIMAGGDHSITYPCIKAFHDSHTGPIGVIQLDAHRDLMDFSDRQGRYSGSSGMRRALELPQVTGHNFVQVGLRGYTTVEQYEVAEALGVQAITTNQFNQKGAKAVAEQALAWASQGTEAIYMTVDLDVVNPGEAPGTGWPEPGGLTAQQLLDFVNIVAPNVTAIDVAELNPNYDSPARTTAILAARIVLDCIVAQLR